MLNESQQIEKLLQGKKDILITFRKDGSGDAIASATALALYLENLGKRADIVIDEFDLPKNLNFLKKSKTIKPNFSHLQKFIITVDSKKTGVHELSYDLKEDNLRIFITPKKGFLTRNDIRTAQSDFKYDLIFTIDSPTLESLGSIYDNNTELFYDKPIINIDYKTTNEHFGQINTIETTATSTGEVLFNLLEGMNAEHISDKVAEAILTAIISNTRSFKSQNIKPHTLSLASKLMKLGADRDYIVQNLYRTKTLSTLKLWGKALSNIEHDRNSDLVWTSITRDDFVRSGAHAHELYDIVDELISNSPEADLIALFHEKNSETDKTPHVNVILNANKGYNASNLLQPFHPVVGDKKRATTVIAGKTLKEVEEEVINYIKKTV